jgi:HK97 family phage major capsid protein
LGLLTSLTSPIWTTGSAKLVLADFNAIYFAVNRFYRAQPKCGWLMSDSVYQRVRNAQDDLNRPLIDVVDDEERILGKPLYICPSMGAVTSSPAANGTIAFGDLGHMHLRCSRPTIQRVLNSTQFDVTQGLVGYVGRIRFDSALFDPSNGNPPIVIASVSV